MTPRPVTPRPATPGPATPCPATTHGPVSNQAALAARLEHYFIQVDRLLLQRQDPVTGLFPASTAVTVHGDYTDAWVRDNVYSILAVWGLALAYRRSETDDTRHQLLDHAVIKLMRGLLFAMMQQADKVERFKYTQAPLDALHAKYNTRSGEVVVADDKWGHLQLDATSIYLLMLAQMTRAGLRIVLNLDEVCFVQNLVYYIGQAYRTPDYGIWERGNKINKGRPEINASSVGMAKAALESMRELNVFGAEGDARSVIHVVADDIAHARTVLHTLLPHESLSKETDAALLAIVGYPAFAVDDPVLAMRTREQVIAKLAGPYGLKRFLLDGHQTVIEDTSRLHYEEDELRHFANIESEWPLFYCYLRLDALFRQDVVAAASYRDKLRKLTEQQNGLDLLPELYYVPKSALAAERAMPGSQTRLPNHNVPLVWAQSLYLLGDLISDGLLLCEDIDPLLRHRRSQRNRPLPVVRVAVVAETEQVKARLSVAGIAAQLPEEVPTIQFGETEDLARILQSVGRNDKLQLSGRPFRHPCSLAAAQAYRVAGRLHLFFCQIQKPDNFYLTLDNGLLLTRARAEISHIARYWDQPSSPLLLVKLSAADFNNTGTDGAEAWAGVLRELQTGQCAGVPIQLSTISELLGQLAPIDLAVDLPADRFRNDANTNPDDASGEPSHQRWLDQYSKAASMDQWATLRLAAGSLNKMHAGLADAVAELITWQRQVVIGRGSENYATISTPLANDAIHALLHQHAGLDRRASLLIQEILVYLVMLVRIQPALLEGLLSVRVSQLLAQMINELAAENSVTQDAAFELLCAQAPHEGCAQLQTLLERGLVTLGCPTGNLVCNSAGISIGNSINNSISYPSPHQCTTANGIARIEFLAVGNSLSDRPPPDWRQWRVRAGVISRYPASFHADIWHMLKHCAGIMLGNRNERKRLLDAKAVHGATTPNELAFALHVEDLLNDLSEPSYRQLTVEALMALAAMFDANKTLHLNDCIVLDVLLNDAVKGEWMVHHPEHVDNDNDYDGAAWNAFYSLPPHAVANAIVRAAGPMLHELRVSIVP